MTDEPRPDTAFLNGHQESPGPGRPREFSRELLRAIIDRIAEGELLLTICKTDGMPSTRHFYRLIAADAELAREYVFAMHCRTQNRLDMAAECAADSKNDMIPDFAEGPDGASIPTMVFNPRQIARSKVFIETQFKLVAEEKAKKYADPYRYLPQEVANELEGPRDPDEAAVIEGQILPAVEHHPLTEVQEAFKRAAAGDKQ